MKYLVLGILVALLAWTPIAWIQSARDAWNSFEEKRQEESAKRFIRSNPDLYPSAATR